MDRLNNSEAITEAREREISVFVGWQRDFDVLLGRIHLAMDKNWEKERDCDLIRKTPDGEDAESWNGFKMIIETSRVPILSSAAAMRSLPC